MPKWRKEFKSAWKKAENKQITMPMNKKYRPDIKRFVCTCPQFVISCFLVCKHLVQLFLPVSPLFFLKVTRNHTPPFWSHSALKPLEDGDNNDLDLEDQTPTGDGDGEGDGDDNKAGVTGNNTMVNTTGIELDLDDLGIESDDSELVDTWEGIGGKARKTYKEDMHGNINLLWGFCDALEYQIQFGDPQFLRTLEKEGSRLFRLEKNCFSREKSLTSNRATYTATWERSTANAMFYQSRPHCDT